MSDDKFTLKVMLLGGRRVGKTSILASMYDCFGEVFDNTPFIFTPDDAPSEIALVHKARELKSYYILASKGENFEADEESSSEDHTYSFSLKLKNKEKSEIGIEFYDYPGEWFTEEDPYKCEMLYEKLENKIKNSQILIIVIDTPYLMEEYGLYNDKRNICDIITARIEKSFLNVMKDKMVLFLPIKCEYEVEKGLEEVTNSLKTDDVYGKLIRKLTAKDVNCTVAILPILTIGTALFTDFKRNPDGKIKLLKDKKGKELYGTSLYYFSKRAKEVAIEKKLKYKYAAEPKLCEQPLLYILLFAIDMYVKIKKENSNNNFWENLLNWFGTTFLNWSSAEDFISNRPIIEKKTKFVGDGFEIISDPLHIRS